MMLNVLKLLTEDGSLAIGDTFSRSILPAVSHHIKFGRAAEPCSLAEYELLAKSGKPILAALISAMQRIQAEIQKNSVTLNKSTFEKCLALAELDHDKHVVPTISFRHGKGILFGVFDLYQPSR